MKTYLWLSLILLLDLFLLLIKVDDLSISYHEILLLERNTPFSFLINTVLDFFGRNDFVLRFPMIISHLLSSILLFLISKRYLKHEKDSLWLVFIFGLIPAIASSAILVDPAGLVLFLILLYVYIFDKYKNIHYLLLFTYVWLDISFSLLYLGIFFFSLYSKNRLLLVSSTLLFILSMYLFDFDTRGSPTGHFLDIFGLYTLIFSPVIFLYSFYVLYRRFILKELDILWFLSSSALSLSLLLSFRQNIPLEMFAPYFVLSFPLTAQTFFRTYRIRLRQFRVQYRFLFRLSLGFLLLNFMAVFFNQYLYYFIDNPRANFAYKSHIAKELSSALIELDIRCVDVGDYTLQKRIEYYGVTKCSTPVLRKKAVENLKEVTISYKGKEIYQRSVDYSNI